MDAVSVIKNNMDVETILKSFDINYEYYGDYIRCACPIHGGDNPTAFVINEDFLWSCHTGDCGGGDAFTFFELMEEIPFPQAVKRVAEVLGIDIENLTIAERKNEYQKELENFLKYIKSKKKKVELKEFTLDVEAKSVKKFRDFKEDTLKHFGLQYAKEITIEKKKGGFFSLYERLIIPIYIDGKQIGASLRKIKASDNPKWFHIPHTMETGDILYNIDACKDDSVIIVCEGMFDVWKWYEAGYNAVCTFGAHLTDMQYKTLLKTGKDIVWSYDGDNAGQVATKRAIDVFKYKANQWVIKFNEDRDPGSHTPTELDELYKKKERIL